MGSKREPLGLNSKPKGHLRTCPGSLSLKSCSPAVIGFRRAAACLHPLPSGHTPAACRDQKQYASAFCRRMREIPSSPDGLKKEQQKNVDPRETSHGDYKVFSSGLQNQTSCKCHSLRLHPCLRYVRHQTPTKKKHPAQPSTSWLWTMAPFRGAKVRIRIQSHCGFDPVPSLLGDPPRAQSFSLLVGCREQPNSSHSSLKPDSYSTRLLFEGAFQVLALPTAKDNTH